MRDETDSVQMGNFVYFLDNHDNRKYSLCMELELH